VLSGCRPSGIVRDDERAMLDDEGRVEEEQSSNSDQVTLD